MRNAFALFLITLFLTACSKSSSSSSVAASSNAAPASAVDPVERKLQELSGSGATNCGHLKSQTPDQMDAAAKCAMQAAKEKHAFYVAYELPGMLIAVAGNADGKLFTVQSEDANAPGLAGRDCPSELRVAPSGRVTCFAPGAFGMSTGAAHGSMQMPPAGANPHQGTGNLPPGHPKPPSK